MAKKAFTLYWSSLDRYENCPQQFLWGKGWGTIDCGGGPGRKKPKPYERDRSAALMGIAIQFAIERMYKDQLWRHPGLSERLRELALLELKRLIHKEYVDFRKISREEMEEVTVAGVDGYLATFKEHKLIGPYADAEVDLVGFVNKWTPIGGRVDLIFKREDTGVTLLDGKNSRRYKDRKDKEGKRWMTFTDPDQLRWYALCFYLAYRKLPDRLGFTYYRYPFGAPRLWMDGTPVLDEEGQPVIETGVEWVDFTKDDIKGLAQRAVDARKGMDREKFPAKPSPDQCRYCDWESVCPERQAQKEANRRTRKPGSGGTLDVSEGQPFTIGFGPGGSSGAKKG